MPLSTRPLHRRSVALTTALIVSALVLAPVGTAMADDTTGVAPESATVEVLPEASLPIESAPAAAQPVEAAPLAIVPATIAPAAESVAEPAPAGAPVEAAPSASRSVEPSSVMAVAAVHSEPTGIVVTQLIGGVNISWSPPATAGVMAVEHYVYQYRAVGSSNWGHTFLLSSGYRNPNSYFTGGTTREFRFAAVDGTGTTGAYAFVTATAGLLGAPTITGWASGDNFGANWTLPSDGGPHGFASVEVEYAVNGGAWMRYSTFPLSTTSLSNRSFAGNSFAFRARAVDTDYNVSEWAESVPVVTGIAPGAPQSLAATAGVGSITVSWDAPATPGTGVATYSLQYRESSASTWTDGAPTTARTSTVSGIAGTYSVRLRASNAVGSSAWVELAQPVTAIAPLVAPGNLIASAGDRSVTLAWDVPTANVGAGYAIEARPVAGTWSAVGQTAQTTTVVTGLDNRTTYEFRVTATSIAQGVGPASVVTATPQAIAPAAPTDLVLRPGDAWIDVEWTAPTVGRVTGYVVEVTAPGEAPRSLTTTSTSRQVVGLTNAVEYTVTVRALNETAASASVTGSIYAYRFLPVFTLADGSTASGATLRPGDVVTISGTGALPDFQVVAELHSDPIALGDTRVAADGSFRLVVTIPATAPAGSHSLVVFLGGGGGVASSASIGVTVAAVATVTAAAAAGRPVLAATGADPDGMLALAAALLALGGAVGIRRRWSHAG